MEIICFSANVRQFNIALRCCACTMLILNIYLFIIIVLLAGQVNVIFMLPSVSGWFVRMENNKRTSNTNDYV